jgi:hypothetical protein
MKWEVGMMAVPYGPAHFLTYMCTSRLLYHPNLSSDVLHLEDKLGDSHHWTDTSRHGPACNRLSAHGLTHIVLISHMCPAENGVHEGGQALARQHSEVKCSVKTVEPESVVRLPDIKKTTCGRLPRCPLAMAMRANCLLRHGTSPTKVGKMLNRRRPIETATCRMKH